MKRIFFVIIICMACSYNIYAQEAYGFEFIIPDTIIENSFYNRIGCMDELSENPDFGYISTSAFSSYKPVVDQVPIQVQLDSLMQRITDETARKQTLLLQLRALNFGQDSKAASCHLRFTLYAIRPDSFLFLNRLDTVITSKPKNIMDETSFAITGFIIANLRYMPLEEELLTMDDVSNIDLYEKKSIPAYVTGKFTDGIYYSFASFARQQPDEDKMQVKMKGDAVKEVEVMNAGKNKWEKVKPGKIFAVVAGGKAHVVDSKRYYPVHKDGSDLLFTAEKPIGSAVAPIGGGVSISTGSRGTGIGGGVIIRIGSQPKEKVTFKIDHLNGDFVFVDKE